MCSANTESSAEAEANSAETEAKTESVHDEGEKEGTAPLMFVCLILRYFPEDNVGASESRGEGAALDDELDESDDILGEIYDGIPRAAAYRVPLFLRFEQRTSANCRCRLLHLRLRRRCLLLLLRLRSIVIHFGFFSLVVSVAHLIKFVLDT